MSTPNRREVRRERVRDRFGLMLILLIGAFVSMGAASNVWGRIIPALLVSGALYVAFTATGLGRDHRLLGPLAILAAVTIVLTALPDEREVASGIGDLATTLLFFAILVATLNRVLRHKTVTMQTIYGAVCAYFLIGLMFSAGYSAFDALTTAPLFGEPVDASVYSYFSFTTLTTVGFGDYTVKPNLARRIVVIEAVLGQVFIATALARLVSLLRSPRSAES